MEFDLYVPAANFPLACDPKSAIVGSPARQWMEDREARIDARSPRMVAPDTNLVIDYEGNRYSAMNIRTYADRAAHAAGRQKEFYPTVARMIVPAKRLIRVATFDYEREQVRCLGEDCVLMLMEWLEVDHAALQDELRGTTIRTVRAARSRFAPSIVGDRAQQEAPPLGRSDG
jgi:hypothetical protein